MQTIDMYVKYILLFVACKDILCAVCFAKDVEDWFGNGN